MRRFLPLLLSALVGAGAASAAPAEAAHPEGLPSRPAQSARVAPRFASDRLLVRADPAVVAEHGFKVRRAVGRRGFLVVDTGGRPAAAVREELAADPRVSVAELDVVRHAAATPNDTFFSLQQDELRRVRLPQAWDRVKAGTSQVIAVIDSGADLGHPDLRLTSGYDFVGNDALPEDENGHGTMVAGIAGARTDNGAGVAGASWGGAVMPLRVLAADGFGVDSNVAAAIEYAVDHGADVINLSLGGPGTTTVLRDAVDYAASRNVVVVAASGNDANGVASYPAAFASVLAVGGTDPDGHVAFFSQHGPWVDVVAPGVGIASTAPDGLYAQGDGTSFAAPIAAGVAALVRQQNPGWSAAQVVDRLQRTAQDNGPVGVDDSYGFGVLDAYAAVGGPRAAAIAPRAGDGSEPNPVPNAARTFANSTSGTISPEGDVDWYAVELVAGHQRFTLTPATDASSDQKMDPVLSVYGPDRSELGRADEDDPERPETMEAAETLTVQVGVPGRHLVRVASATGSRSPGQYTLTVAPTASLGSNEGDGHVWVTDTSPRSYASGVAVTTVPTVTFARPMDSATLGNVRLVHGRTRATVAVTRTYDIVNHVLRLRPSSALAYSTPYQVRIEGVRDVEGTPIQDREVVLFRTRSAPVTTTTTTTRPQSPPPPPPPSRSGYWMVDSRGYVYGFGDARHHGALNGARDNVVDLEPTPSGNGYWLLTTAGEVFAYGDARHAGQPSAFAPGERVTAMSAHPRGAGYWVFTNHGRVFAFGGAPFHGDMSGAVLNGPVLDSVATPSGSGYYMVASDGGIFAFGDARFRGSMGDHRLNAPVQSLVPDGDNDGYWLVASDGGIFAFAAPFRGSMGSSRLNRPVTGMVRFGDGYLMVGEDGGIFNFSSKRFHGSLGDNPPPQPVVAVAALED